MRGWPTVLTGHRGRKQDLKKEIPNNKWFDKLTTTLSQVEGQITMTKIQNRKPVYDLEERTFQFAKAVRLFVKTLPKTIANILEKSK